MIGKNEDLFHNWLDANSHSLTIEYWDEHKDCVFAYDFDNMWKDLIFRIMHRDGLVWFEEI